MKEKTNSIFSLYFCALLCPTFQNLDQDMKRKPTKANENIHEFPFN